MAGNDSPTFQVCLAMSRLDDHKAADAWGVKAEIEAWRHPVGMELLKLIIKVYNSEWNPDNWRRAVLIPIPKAGDTTLIGSYRGICILVLHRRRTQTY